MEYTDYLVTTATSNILDRPDIYSYSNLRNIFPAIRDKPNKHKSNDYAKHSFSTITSIQILKPIYQYYILFLKMAEINTLEEYNIYTNFKITLIPYSKTLCQMTYIC